MKKYTVTFLLDKKNLWFEKQIRTYKFKNSNKYVFSISKNYKKIKKQNIVFPISYTKILSKKFLSNHEHVLIPHPSKLPKDKGFAPIQNQILKKQNKFFISLIKAVEKVDEGPICIQNHFNINKTDLSIDIRRKQGKAYLKIIEDFLNIYPKVNFKAQIGKGNFNKKRTPNDSEISINKTIKAQFDKIRICDNELYPAYFFLKKKKFIIKIYKK